MTVLNVLSRVDVCVQLFMYTHAEERKRYTARLLPQDEAERKRQSLLR